MTPRPRGLTPTAYSTTGALHITKGTFLQVYRKRAVPKLSSDFPLLMPGCPKTTSAGITVINEYEQSRRCSRRSGKVRRPQSLVQEERDCSLEEEEDHFPSLKKRLHYKKSCFLSDHCFKSM